MKNFSFKAALIPVRVKEPSKIVGYFSYTDSGNILCELDACVIAGTEERMQTYLNRSTNNNEKDIIRKTNFGEIMNGLKQGGAYAFDEGAYGRFFDLAKMNGMDVPKKEVFLEQVSTTGTHFIILQAVG